ncbi:MAG: ribosome maturation factor RimP [Actinomycetota bacterium]|nr:ribosome maturation factor RimP [Actinomycetota bacterium]
MPRPEPEQLCAGLRPTVERAVSSIGFDLEEIDIRQAGRRKLVRVVVDGDSGVGLDDIATLSRRVAAELDEQDEVLGGPYTLEVTSPGVDRPLTASRHWRRAHLRMVEISLVEGRTVTGRVGRAGDTSVQVLLDGVPTEVRYAEVERAVVRVEFRQPPAADLRALGVGLEPDHRSGDVAEEQT